MSEKNRRTEFFMVDNALVRHFGAVIGVYGVAVYNVLALHANKHREAWPSQQTIAGLLGCSRKKVNESVKLLEKFNLIRVEERVGGNGKFNVMTSTDAAHWNYVTDSYINNTHFNKTQREGRTPLFFSKNFQESASVELRPGE